MFVIASINCRKRWQVTYGRRWARLLLLLSWKDVCRRRKQWKNNTQPEFHSIESHCRRHSFGHWAVQIGPVYPDRISRSDSISLNQSGRVGRGEIKTNSGHTTERPRRAVPVFGKTNEWRVHAVSAKEQGNRGMCLRHRAEWSAHSVLRTFDSKNNILSWVQTRLINLSKNFSEGWNVF